MTDTLTRKTAGFRFVETFYGDTMQRIALRELGDAARWVEIVSLNDLRPPYISDIAASDGVILSGSLLRIPASGKTQVASAETNPDIVFGVDVRLANDGVLSVTEGGDFQVVGGLDNLKQALRDLLATDSGELMFHPDYGTKIRRIIGQGVGPTSALLAAAYAKAALENDSRIERVVSSDAEAVGDTIRITAKVQPIVGRTVDISQVL